MCFCVELPAISVYSAYVHTIGLSPECLIVLTCVDCENKHKSSQLLVYGNFFLFFYRSTYLLADMHTYVCPCIWFLIGKLTNGIVQNRVIFLCKKKLSLDSYTKPSSKAAMAIFNKF